MKSHFFIVLTSVVVSTAVNLLLSVAFDGTFHNEANKTVSTYSTIQSSGTIRAAYTVGAPLFMVDPNTGEKTGIFYDAVNAMASHLGIKVDWTQEVGYGEMIQGLRDNRYDIIGSGVWINADRAKGADFTIPLYYDAVFAYAKTGDTRFVKGISALNTQNVTISTMDGELGARIAKTDFPNANTLALPQNAGFSQMIENVLTGKADIVFLAASSARAYQATNPGRITVVDPDKPLRIFPDAIMIPQGQYELRQALNYALMEMLNDGEIDAILKKYEAAPGSFLRTAMPYLSPPTQ